MTAIRDIAEIQEIPVVQIQPGDNDREAFDAEGLRELAEKTGVIQGFKEFVMRGNVIALAVAGVVGDEFTDRQRAGRGHTGGQVGVLVGSDEIVGELAGVDRDRIGQLCRGYCLQAAALFRAHPGRGAQARDAASLDRARNPGRGARAGTGARRADRRTGRVAAAVRRLRAAVRHAAGRLRGYGDV